MKRKLSKKEAIVFDLIGKGLKNAEIARRLKLSPRTIETFRGRLLMKLGLSSTTELVKAWILSEVETKGTKAITIEFLRQVLKTED